MAEDMCSIGMSLQQERNLLAVTRSVGRYQRNNLPEKYETLLYTITHKKSTYNLVFAVIMKKK